MSKFKFYQEVEVLDNCLQKECIGKKGVITGISEENGIIYGYAVDLYDKEYGYYFKTDCLKPTGKQFKRENFY